jgi:hypothetical protein
MGRKPIIDTLPAEARQALITWLSDPAMTQEAARDQLDALLEEMGHEARPSLSAVNRYAQRFSALLAKQRERHEVAETWIGQFGRIPEGQLGQLIIQMVHGLAFETSMQLEDMGRIDPEDMPGVVRMLKDLATTIERTERASSLNAAREADIRERARTEAADTAVAAATQQGLSAETVEALRRQILGVD